MGTKQTQDRMTEKGYQTPCISFIHCARQDVITSSGALALQEGQGVQWNNWNDYNNDWA